MNCLDDTIAAISTPIGEGGIGIVRLSGSNSITIADHIFFSPKGKNLKDTKSHTIVYGFIINPTTGERIDEVLVSVMKAPRTYTMEDVVEINCHGGILSLRTTLRLLLDKGVRLAEPGEFTKRAFLNGRIDLSRAEAVIDVIRSKTEQSERLAFQHLEGRLSIKITDLRNNITDICIHIEAHIDFPEDELELMTRTEIINSMSEIETELSNLSKGYNEGRFFREGVSTAIVGKPNVGKSSILNALLQRDKAIVTGMPGTTRDIIEDYLNIDGLPLRVIDTAGIRESYDLAEVEGVRRTLRAIEDADVVLAILDASRPIDEADAELMKKVKDKKAIAVINKSDIESAKFKFPDDTNGKGDAAWRSDAEAAEKSHIDTSASCCDTVPVVKVSALKGDGLDELKNAIYSLCISSSDITGTEGVIITNMRHKHSIDRALESLREASETFENGEPFEVVAISLRESLHHLGEIIGVVTTEDILDRIFSDFCIGK
ncbi:tRNA uridine-5-carboxymethylaminomethyl(34) synthesis GTPase MnmE [Thermodesulfovibrionales bacterium]|nr:tRNA uridine-5-carboxymethylaminomethyl(34) synthesis GTPase MnmE [Thermodesulfovibrionales bacterium]